VCFPTYRLQGYTLLLTWQWHGKYVCDQPSANAELLIPASASETTTQSVLKKIRKLYKWRVCNYRGRKTQRRVVKYLPALGSVIGAVFSFHGPNHHTSCLDKLNSFPASPKIPCILQVKVHHCGHKSPPLVPVLRQINTAQHTMTETEHDVNHFRSPQLFSPAPFHSTGHNHLTRFILCSGYAVQLQIKI
jgi:hypothetical protein